MGMFDLTPDMVPLAQQAQDTQQATNAANMPLGSGQVYAGSLAGNMIGRGIAGGALGYQDPRLAQAQKMQAAMKDTQALGIDFGADPVAYMTAASKNLFKYGLYEQGMTVADKIKELAQGQSAQATAAATNQKTMQEMHAERRIQQITSDATGPTGYDQKAAVSMMMRDPNPAVQKRGVELAKEYQALQIGKTISQAPGAKLYDTEAKKFIDSGPEFGSMPGESANETNRRVLGIYRGLAQAGQLTPEQLVMAKQRYQDYLNQPIQGVGFKQAPINDELNPYKNWGLGPAGTGVAVAGAGITPTAAPQGGGAGRTSPVQVDLPGGGGGVEAGYMQGAKGAKEVDDQVREFSQALVKNNVPQLDRAFSNVQAALDKYPPGKVPGMGGVWNSGLANYVTAIGQQIGDPELKKQMAAARDTRTSVVAVTNYITRIMAGLNQTQGESARIMMENATGVDSTEEDFRNSFAKLLTMYKDMRATTLGGYPPEVRQRFSKQSGLNMNDVDSLPPPSMKTLQNVPKRAAEPTPAPLPPPQPNQLQNKTGIEHLSDGRIQTIENGKAYVWPNIETYNNYRKATGQ